MSHSETSHSDHDKVAALAQRFYEEEGKPEGRADEHWFRAERALRGETGGQAPNAEERPPIEASGEDFR